MQAQTFQPSKNLPSGVGFRTECAQIDPKGVMKQSAILLVYVMSMTFPCLRAMMEYESKGAAKIFIQSKKLARPVELDEEDEQYITFLESQLDESFISNAVIWMTKKFGYLSRTIKRGQSTLGNILLIYACKKKDGRAASVLLMLDDNPSKIVLFKGESWLVPALSIANQLPMKKYVQKKHPRLELLYYLALTKPGYEAHKRPVFCLYVIDPAQALDFYLPEVLETGEYRYTKGQTPLIWSAIIGDVKSAQRLIQKCDPKIVAMRDHRKKNALEYALEHEHRDIVELLIDAGASVTPKKLLIIALKRGNKQLCYLLIKKGATSSEKAVHKALNKKFDTLAGLLLLRLKGYI